MRWARTLMIADMLTKVIQSNVAHEARPNVTRQDKDALMSDDPLPPTAPVVATPAATAVDTQATTADPAPAPAVTPQSADAGRIGASTGVDVDARLQHATHLAEMLTKNPNVHSFLCVLMGIATEDLSKDI